MLPLHVHVYTNRTNYRSPHRFYTTCYLVLQVTQVIQMENLRQVVLYDLHDKLGDQSRIPSIPTPLPAGRMFTTPTAYLRPAISAAGRGEFSHNNKFAVK